MNSQIISAVTILQFWYRFGIGTIPIGIDVSDRSCDVTNPSTPENDSWYVMHWAIIEVV